MPLQVLEDGDYREGMVRDLPPWQLPNGQVYDALNMLFDRPGVARQRGGTTAIFSGAQTAYGAALGWVYSNDATTIEELYSLSLAGGSRWINQSTGAVVVMPGPGVTLGKLGRPVRHFGFVIFPYSVTFAGASPRFMTAFAGIQSNTSFINAVVSQVVAGSPTVTLTGADVTTNVKVGAICWFVDATHVYIGRVTAVTAAKTFTVWPVPTFTNAAIAVGNLNTNPDNSTLPAGGSGWGGTCAASFQNRLLMGNTFDMTSTVPYAVTDRRVYYSLLPTETFAVAGSTAAGALFLSGDYVLDFNFFDIPGADPIIGMEPVTDNELLILTPTRPVVFRGNLVTQLSTTSQQVTFDISDLDTSAGCTEDFSIVRTPRGIMWAGTDGIFIYSSGSKPINVLEGRVATYWRELARSATFAIHGAAYIRGHYLVTGAAPTGTPFALLLNLQSREPIFSRASQLDIFNSVARPSNPAQVWALRWWNQSGGAPSMTNGQVIRLESLLDAYVAGSTKTDSDGSTIPFSVTTRVLMGDPETQKIYARGTVRYAASMTAANITVQAKVGIDAADVLASITLGSLSNTNVIGISAATNATPIVCTTGVNHGLQTDDFIDCVFATGNTHVNGRWRVKVTSATQFELVGSSGNGAYAGGGQFRKLNESDYMMTTLAQGQGVSFTVASSGTVNNFELHGLRVAYYAGKQVQSA